MKISGQEECCLTISIAHPEKGKGVALGLNEFFVPGVSCVAGTVISDAAVAQHRMQRV